MGLTPETQESKVVKGSKADDWMIGNYWKSGSVGPAEELILLFYPFLQEILPSDYVSAAVPLQNHRTSFWNLCKKSILFPLYASFMGLQVLSSFVSLAFCVLIILGGK